MSKNRKRHKLLRSLQDLSDPVGKGQPNPLANTDPKFGDSHFRNNPESQKQRWTKPNVLPGNHEIQARIQERDRLSRDIAAKEKTNKSLKDIIQRLQEQINHYKKDLTRVQERHEAEKARLEQVKAEAGRVEARLPESRLLTIKEMEKLASEKHTKAERDLDEALAIREEAERVAEKLREDAEKDAADIKKAAEQEAIFRTRAVKEKESELNMREAQLGEQLKEEAKKSDVLRQEIKRLQEVQSNLKNAIEEEKRKNEESTNRLKSRIALYKEHARELEEQCARHVEREKLILSDKQKLERERKRLSIQVLERDKQIEDHEKEIRKHKRKIERVDRELSQLRSSAFSIPAIDVVQALSTEVSELFELPDQIVTIGSGPFEEKEFARYLKSMGIKSKSKGGSWIVVGRQDWDESDLIALVENAEEDKIRVFSQELFIAGILSTHNPFSLPHQVLMKFAEGHPALEFLIEGHFDWPEIEPEVYGEPEFLGWEGGQVEQSPIRSMGYRVGKTSDLPASVRREILEEAYRGDIPDVGDAAYMEEWGRPGRPKRLWRIAHHIAWLIRTFRRIPSRVYAVEDWEGDLKWLRRKFHRERGARFSWPHT